MFVQLLTMNLNKSGSRFEAFAYKLAAAAVRLRYAVSRQQPKLNNLTGLDLTGTGLSTIQN